MSEEFELGSAEADGLLIDSWATAVARLILPCQAKQVPDDGEEWRIFATSETAFMAFGGPMHRGQSLGQKNLTDCLKWAVECGENP